MKNQVHIKEVDKIKKKKNRLLPGDPKDQTKQNEMWKGVLLWINLKFSELKSESVVRKLKWK